MDVSENLYHRRHLSCWRGVGAAVGMLEMLQKVTGKLCHGLQPTHLTQPVDLNKKISPSKITHAMPAIKNSKKREKILHGDPLKIILPE